MSKEDDAFRKFVEEKITHLSQGIDMFLEALFKRRMCFNLVIFDKSDQGKMNLYISNVKEPEELLEAMKVTLDMIENYEKESPDPLDTLH